MTTQEIQQCLTLLKQALSCPICLDDLKEPVISPCSHMFCKFCIQEYMRRKTSIRCPCCKKDFTRRSLSSTGKLIEITAVTRELFNNFAEESQVDFQPVTKFESLHLSQEFSQAVPRAMPGKVIKRLSRRGTPKPGKKIALGANARNFMNKLRTKNRQSTSDSEELTQPMRAPSDDASNQENADPAEPQLFGMTQAPLPGEVEGEALSEFPDLSTRRERSNSDQDSVTMRLTAAPVAPSDANRKRRFGSRRSSKLSIISNLKRSSFVRSLSRGGKRRYSSRSPSPGEKSVSSGSSSSEAIPPLRERLSAALPPSTATPSAISITTTMSGATRVVSPSKRVKRRRKTNELYSPWLRNSHMHFLKKYRVVTSAGTPRGRRISNESPGGRRRSGLFSPGWSRLKSLSLEFGRQSKKPLQIRSSKRFSRSYEIFGDRRGDEQELGENKAAAPSRPVCKFILSSTSPLFAESVAVEAPPCQTVVCGNCGAEVIVSSHVPPIVVCPTSPKPCPVVRDATAYFPENWLQTPVGDKSMNPLSPATSVVTIQPSIIPQTFSLEAGEAEGTQRTTTTLATPSTINIQPSLVPQSLSLSPLASTKPVADDEELTQPQVFEYTAATEERLLVSQMTVEETPLNPCGVAATPASVGTGRDQSQKQKPAEVANIHESQPQQQQEDELAKETQMDIDTVLIADTEEVSDTSFDLISASPESVTAVEAAPIKAVSSPSLTSPPATSTQSNVNAPQVPETVVPDFNSYSDSDDVDIIPSSQTEEVEAEAGGIAGAAAVSSSAVLVGPMETSSTHSTTVTPARVESSQTTERSHPASSSTSLSGMPVSSFIADTENVFPWAINDEEEDEETASALARQAGQPNIVITGSGLQPEVNIALRRFCSQFGAHQVSGFDATEDVGPVTHVVVATEPARPFVAQRTFKFFMGILAGCWVVNHDWLRKCLLANKLLPEEPFEVQGDVMCGMAHGGPRRGRLRIPTIGPQLAVRVGREALQSNPEYRRPFAELMVCAFGDLRPLPTSDFAALVAAGGGIPVTDVARIPPDVLKASAEASARANSTTPYEITAVELEGRVKCLLVTSPIAPGFDRQACFEAQKKYGFPIVNINWLFNCACLYRRLPLGKVYLITPHENSNQQHSRPR